MEAVCQGCSSAGGLSIGVLPELDLSRSNSHCSIVLPTDLGNADKPIIPEGRGFPTISRNRVIVGSAFCVFVISGTSGGTGDEVRLAREFRIRAFGLCKPATPKGHPNLWRDRVDGLFSEHATLKQAMDAFDSAFPKYAKSFQP
jgi:hypothetical protein